MGRAGSWTPRFQGFPQARRPGFGAGTPDQENFYVAKGDVGSNAYVAKGDVGSNANYTWVKGTLVQMQIIIDNGVG